jgi:hypothetical protein
LCQPDASRSCAAFFFVVHTEKTNWVLEILKLRKVEAIIALLDHATLHTYAAHALSNIASGRDGTRRAIQPALQQSKAIAVLIAVSFFLA